MNYTHLVNFQH